MPTGSPPTLEGRYSGRTKYCSSSGSSSTKPNWTASSLYAILKKKNKKK